MNDMKSQDLLEELIEAVRDNFASETYRIILNGAHVNGALDYVNLTPLHHAATHNAVNSAKILLWWGADPYIETNPSSLNQGNQTPLDIAREVKSKEIIKLLENFVGGHPHGVYEYARRFTIKEHLFGESDEER